MAIFRCNKCGYLREVMNDYIGKSVHCPQCKQVNTIYDTVEFIEKVLAKSLTQYKELQQLRVQLQQLRVQLTPTESTDMTSVKPQPLADMNIYNTTDLTHQHQYEPIVAWFERQHIQLGINHRAIDTTGFFDEVAIQLGNQYDTLKFVIDQIRYIQQKGYTNVKITLSNSSQKQIATITRFCQELYDYSFVTKYSYQKQTKVIWLTLQTVPSIVKFFNGEWMEWFVFMKLLEFFHKKQLSVACLRGFTITFPNQDIHEIDVFFLINDTLPLCIECKTGEFRRDIEKYYGLRKRLNLDTTQFLVCVVGLSDEQAQGLSSMYNLTFVNERNFLQHVEQLIS